MIIENTDPVIVVFSNVPDEALGREMARTLVQEGHAACVHLFPAGSSFYIWEGKLQEDREWTLMVKSCLSRWSDLKVRIKAMHPYEVPEILMLPVQDGLPAYLQWVRR
ncbi:MAG: divalent-cation tolerance protein CutA [Magnetococcales bacterium]|nr:divalent-cation tolerance protein CutA [Magnetococcales bacterium]